MHLAKLVWTILAPGATLLWAADDTLCRKRGLTVYGTGMHHDPLISSQKCQALGQLGDMIGSSFASWWFIPSGRRLKSMPCPLPCVFIATAKDSPKARKGKPRRPNASLTPIIALAHNWPRELIRLIAYWFPNDDHLVTGDSRLWRPKRLVQNLPANVHLISHVHAKGRPVCRQHRRFPRKRKRSRKKGERLPGMAAWANDPKRPWTQLEFDQFGLHAVLAVKTQQALYYKSGGQRLLNIVLTRDCQGKTTRPNVLLHQARLGCSANPLNVCLSVGN